MKKLIICAICALCGFTTANAQQKFGHVNSQEIIQAMPEFSKARTEIEALTKQYEADLKSMYEELQKKGDAYEKEQATLPANIKEPGTGSGSAGEDERHHYQGAGRYQGCRSGWQLHLYHGYG